MVKYLRGWWCLFMLVQNACVMCFAQQADTVTYAPVIFPATFKAALNIPYVQVGNWVGLLDVYFDDNAERPLPVVFNIHGGGWNHGVKESQTGFSTFFKAGFAVVNLEYRLTVQATAPAAVEDTRCAMMYVLSHAKQYNIDVNRVVMMGGSAGGHLALMGGLLGDKKLFDKNCKDAPAFTVAAIIDKYGITDVWDWGYGTTIKSKSAVNWMGKYANDAAFAASVSPIHYVNSSSPPVFIVHGDADPTVPYAQSVSLHERLQAAGVTTKFVTIKGGLHGKFSREENSEINRSVIAFINALPAFKNK